MNAGTHDVKNLHDAGPQAHLEAQEFFDRIAEDYRRRSETCVFNTSSLSFRRRQDIVIELLKHTSAGGTVLDYGMGPAVFGPPAINQGLRYIGIDISPAMVELARKLNLPNSEYHLGDLQMLEPFKGGAETVLLIGLLDYLEDPAEGLRQLSRCVKPGGRLIMSFRNHYSVPRVLRNAAKQAWRIGRPSRHKQATAFEAPVLENSFVPARDFMPLLQAEGFSDFEIRYLDCSPVFFNVPLPPALWRLWKRADAFLAGAPLSFLCASGALMAYNKK